MKNFFKKFFGRKSNIFLTFLIFGLFLILSGFAQFNFSSASENDSAASSSAILPSASPSNSLAANRPVGGKIIKFDASGKFVEDEVVVKFKAGVTDAEKLAAAAENGTNIDKDLPYAKLKILKVDPTVRDETIQKLKSNPKVEYAGPNYAAYPGTACVPIPNDPKCPDQWHLSRISAFSAWNRDQHRGNSNIKVAVVDTGIHYNLPEFGLVEDGGRVIRGWDAVNTDDDPWDDNGHGTVVAGVLGARTNNGIDVAGVDWAAQIIAVKVGGASGGAGTGQMADGLEWLVDTNPPGLKVVNISYYMPVADPNVTNAVSALVNRGILVVVIVKNSVAGTSNCDATMLPKIPGVLAVVGTDENDAHYTGCTQGVEGFLMSAPGANIWSESAQQVPILAGGTSFAAPQVAGAASILFSCPGIPALGTVRAALIAGSKDLGMAGYDPVYGYGRLDMFKAMQYVPGCGGSVLRGDVDCNQNVNAIDALWMLRYMIELTTGVYTCPVNIPSEMYLPNADSDGDGDVDGVDALFALQVYTGKRYQGGGFVPPHTDTDGDGMTDGEEASYPCLNPFIADANSDFDLDTLTNVSEFITGSSPCLKDTDGDEFSDYVEFKIGTSLVLKCGANAWPPDFNSDRIVDIADVNKLAPPRFFATPPNPSYNVRYDLNADGIIDISDVNLLAPPTFFKTCQ